MPKTLYEGIAAVSSPRHLERGLKSGLQKWGSELLKGMVQSTQQSRVVPVQMRTGYTI